MTDELQLREFGRLICSVAAGKPMTREESCEAYRQVILNEQPELQQGAFLMAHIARGPTTEELSGAWDALDRYDTAKIRAGLQGAVCDIVGTGSDPLKTINCSTPASLIAAGCGLPVAKKGARLVYLPGEAFLQSGWGRLVQSMRFTSAFNIIGPLTRPCEETSRIVIGAYSPQVCDQLIAVLREIGMQGALAPYGMADGMSPELGMDEFSLAGPTRVTELRNGKVETHEVAPEDFGVKRVAFEQIASRGTAGENADAIMEVLRGRYDTPLADFFCINAASALYISEVARDLAHGVELARSALASGKALEKLEQLLDYQGKSASR